MDGMFVNKLVAAVLVALLLFFGMPQIVDRLVGGGGHHAKPGEELHLEYEVDYKVKGSNAPEGPKISIWTYAQAATPAQGERRAALCTSCHTFEKGGANGTGPNLYKLVGRPVASVAGFGYTSALKELGGNWTYERLDGYLKNSQEYVPGTTMIQRFRKDDQRAQLLVYLGSLSDNPVRLPEPPAAEEVAPVKEDHSSDH